MSRAYRISVSDSIKRHIKVEDGIQTTLDLLPILSPDRMMEILAAELEGLGFKREGEEAKRADEDGVEVTVDLKTSTITARLAAESNLEITRKKNATIEEEDMDGAEDELKAKLQQELEKEAESEQDKLRQEVTEQLDRKSVV